MVWIDRKEKRGLKGKKDLNYDSKSFLLGSSVVFATGT